MDINERWGLISEAFRPAAPIDRKDLFAGRLAQMAELMDAINQTGQHAVIFGERGVGKTSLAVTVTDALNSEFMKGKWVAVRVNCDASDTFSRIWVKLFREISLSQAQPRVGFLKEAAAAEQIDLAELLPKKPGSGDVVRLVRQIENGSRLVFVFDEFDRVQDKELRAMLADTIKALSDQLARTTVVVVGVADTVDELIAEHHSVERALAQVHMPRMSPEETAEIITKGLAIAEMDVSESAQKRIVELSQGLPHYTHLVAQLAARAAFDDAHSTTIELAHVNQAIVKAVEKAQQSIRSAYQDATASSRETLYPQVVLACALAQTDDLGYFSARDVRDPLSSIMGCRYEIPAFSRHLHELCESRRGAILLRAGERRRYRFRFRNPLLQPFVIMKGIGEGLL